MARSLTATIVGMSQDVSFSDSATQNYIILVLPNGTPIRCPVDEQQALLIISMIQNETEPKPQESYEKMEFGGDFEEASNTHSNEARSYVEPPIPPPVAPPAAPPVARVNTARVEKTEMGYPVITGPTVDDVISDDLYDGVGEG